MRLSVQPTNVASSKMAASRKQIRSQRRTFEPALVAVSVIFNRLSHKYAVEKNARPHPGALPQEREHHSLVAGMHHRPVKLREACESFFSLPGGDGRGEGEPLFSLNTHS